MTTHQVDGISIVSWEAGPGAPPLVTEIKSLLENGAVQGILVDMAACNGMRADDLEALTEALRVCQDRNTSIGMFSVTDRLVQLVKITGLEAELPRNMGRTEQEAVATLRNGGQPVVTTAEPVLEFEIDLGSAATTAPTARFDAATLSSPDSPTKIMAAAPGPQGEQRDEDLLAIYWADLTSTGYVLGGDGADMIMGAVAQAGPTAAPPAPAPIEEGVIDLGDAIPARRAVDHRRTEVLPVFKFDEGQGGGANWSAKPTGPLEVEFSASPSALAPESAGVFGGSEPAEFSPVDTGSGPPPAVLQARSQVPPQMPAALPDDSDETVMFQPGALDAALLQAGVGVPDAIAEGPTPAMGIRAPAPAPAPAPTDDVEDSDQTVMFQPGALDAALLAEVAAAAGPESAIPTPQVAKPPEEPTPLSGIQVPDGFEVEVRLFLHDYAISSNLHVQLLSQFAKAKEEVLGRSDLQVATGGSRGAVIEIVDQFVQTRLVRRTRSPRIRGGSGFVFSASPKTQNTVQRVLKMWGNPGDRGKLVKWLKQ